jgi:vacuolar-type H+-ATPase subunit E/Vma4
MCQACGFYKGRLVIDMQAKTEARTARITAKKEAIKGQQTEEVVDTIPAEDSAVQPEQVTAGKEKTLAAPEMAKEKHSTPRKEQAA